MSDSVAAEYFPKGYVVDGRYRLEEQLGSSARGSMFRARHIDHQRLAALKLLREVSGDPLRHGRFQREVTILTALGHSNIASVVDYGMHQGRRWLATDWLEGETLAVRIERGPLTLTAALAILRPLLAALASAHAAQLLHRNLKPSNIFMERRDTQGRERLKLLDFAPELPATRGRRRSAVSAELISAYSPPELFAGKALDARSDVFAVGATMIGMLSGGPVFESATTKARLDASFPHARVSVPARVMPGVDAKLIAWMRRATSIEPERRFPDAANMLGELIDLLPRDLRSLSDSALGTNRALAITLPATLPDSMPDAAPPPSPHVSRPQEQVPSPSPTPATRLETTSSTLAPIATASEADHGQDFPAAVAEAAPAAPQSLSLEPTAPFESVQSVLHDSSSRPAGGSLWPVELPLVSVRPERWVWQPTAAGLIGLLILGLGVLAQSRGHRATGSRAEDVRESSAAPASAPKRRTVDELDARPVAKHRPAQPSVGLAIVPPSAYEQPSPLPTAPDPHPSAPAIVPAGDRPIMRDPWREPVPPELKRLREQAIKGALADENKVKALRMYNRANSDDVRGYLLIAQLYMNRLWRTDCGEELTIALERDPSARGAPEILPMLLDMLSQSKAVALAEPLIMKVYGREALDAIELAFAEVKTPAAAERLHALRMRITGDNPQ